MFRSELVQSRPGTGAPADPGVIGKSENGDGAMVGPCACTVLVAVSVRESARMMESMLRVFAMVRLILLLCCFLCDDGITFCSYTNREM